jgi:Rps23 Pro-64 3,4-dihydroxylase Tpa1-like proline 4-hydroxylase
MIKTCTIQRMAPQFDASRLEEIKTRFQRNKPFPHIVMDGFFSDDLCKNLIEQFPKFDKKNALNESGEVGLKATREDFENIGPAYAQLHLYFQSTEFLGTIEKITGIKNLLFDPDYMGGGTHENLSGQDLDQHIDFNYHPRFGWKRRLNLILYLNDNWQSEWGGQLELHEDPWTRKGHSQKIEPVFNRTVIFETSERSWHGFERIKENKNGKGISRKSIALYLYTADQEDASMVPAHSTVYVNSPLPTRLQAGYVLSEDDVQDLRSLVGRRDQHIKWLYEREIQFSIQLNAINAQQIRKRLTTVGQGTASVHQSQTGLCADGWVLREATIPVDTLKDINQMLIKGFVSEHSPKPFILEVLYEDQMYRREFSTGDFSWLIPIAMPKESRCVLKMNTPTSWVPAKVLGGEDQRELSFQLQKLTFFSSTTNEKAGDQESIEETILKIAHLTSKVTKFPNELFQGQVDLFKDGVLYGWVWAPTVPKFKIPVSIFYDGEKVFETKASLHRKDLQEAGKGDGYHGFEVDLTRFKAVKASKIDVYIGNTKCVLSKGLDFK